VYYRSLSILTQPAVEPVTLAEAKTHVRVDTTADDAYISSLIQVAREWCEAYCDETFVHTQYRMTLDSFPTEIELPRPPMATAGTVTAVVVTYTLENQTTAVLATNEYRIDRDSKPGVLRTTYNGSWPSHLLDYNAVSITWHGGRDGRWRRQRRGVGRGPYLRNTVAGLDRTGPGDGGRSAAERGCSRSASRATGLWIVLLPDGWARFAGAGRRGLA
jgi:hypothetical protein